MLADTPSANNRAAPEGRGRGRVSLVGAGPGDPELLTVKACKRLRSADVVLHDDLVSTDVLALISPAAPVINVGKRCGEKKITQTQINALLVSFASQGNSVVRLKSGDPLIFGRGGEEIDALREAGIEVEIVPGITSALAAAAAAQIPLTDRRSADQVLLVSAHKATGQRDWSNYVSPRTTIVIYMPGDHKNVAEGLIRAGMHEQTPCIIISKISQAQEMSIKSTLRQLQTTPPLPAPSILIVGETVAHSSAADSLLLGRNLNAQESHLDNSY